MEREPTPARMFAARLRTRLSIIAIAILASSASFVASTQAATGTVGGTAYLDADGDATVDPGESAMPGHRIYLFRDGAYFGQSTTDAGGRYGFTDLELGRYEVAYDASSWSPLKLELVPTTTGSVFPSHTVEVSGPTVADFGWRTITWSSNPDAPIATYVAPNGLTVKTYNDALAPGELVDAVMGGLVGPEAPRITILFALGSTSATQTSVLNRGGVYEDYLAGASVSYEAWLMNAEQVLAHEYGHAWSWYHAYITQQDATMRAYLVARGLAGDPRVGSSYVWGVGELIAEDYRQLLGPVSGREAPQANREIPPAVAIPGLADFLANTFTHAAPPPPEPSPSPTPSPTPAPSPSPTPTLTPDPLLDVSVLTVSPAPVKRSASITFSLSLPARVTVMVLDATGAVVDSLATGLSEPAGSIKFSWDRTNESGKRVRAGQYTVKVKAESSGASDSAVAIFAVA